MKIELKKLKLWQWFFAIGLFPFTISILIWQKKDWTQNKKLKVLAVMWVSFIAFGVYQELQPDPPPREVAVSQRTESRLEEKKDENAVINQELQDERKDYDSKRGSNAEAAKTAQALIDLAQAATPGTDFDAYIRLDAPDNANKQYELGGDAQEFKNEVSFVGLTIVIDSGVWSSASEEQKKNLIASWSKIMQNQYPNSSGWMKVTNGLRDVAEANWMAAKYNRSPEIKLK